MQSIDVLRYDRHLAAVLALQPRQGQVSGIGLRIPQSAPPQVVEFVHACGIGGKRFGRCHLGDIVLAPDAVLVPEGGETRLGRKPGTCENDDALE